MATKSQGALLRVSSAEATTKVITGITAANPPVVTATAHGYANGDIVRIADVVGMTQVNGRAFVVANQTTNTFEFKGVDGTGYAAYTSGGNSYKQTMIPVSESAALSGFDGEADEIDVTHLQSVAKEYLQGLPDFGNVTIDFNQVVTDAGQTRMRSLKASQASAVFAVTLSDSKVSAFLAFVKSFTFQNAANDAFRGNSVLRITSEPAYFA